MGSTSRAAGSAENETGLNEFGGAMHGEMNVGKDLTSLGFRERRRSQELGICVDRRQIVTQIVRDGTRHATDDGKSFGLKQCLVCMLDLAAHAGEGGAQFQHFPGSAIG